MKSSELSKIILCFNELLGLYPDKDLSELFEDLIKIKKENLKEVDKKLTNNAKKESVSEQEQKKLIDQLCGELDTLSIPDIEAKLRSEDLFPSMDYLRYFASQLGVNLTSRQSKGSSINTLKNYLDRMRIDRTISERND